MTRTDMSPRNQRHQLRGKSMKRARNQKLSEPDMVLDELCIDTTCNGRHDPRYQYTFPEALIKLTSPGFEKNYPDAFKALGARPLTAEDVGNMDFYVCMWILCAFGDYDPYNGLGAPWSMQEQTERMNSLVQLFKWALPRRTHEDWVKTLSHLKWRSHGCNFDYANNPCYGCQRLYKDTTQRMDWLGPECDMPAAYHSDLLQFLDRLEMRLFHLSNSL